MGSFCRGFQGAHKIAACLLYLGRMISKVLWRTPGYHQYNVKHTPRKHAHAQRRPKTRTRAQSLLYLTFLGLSSLFIIFGSSKGVNPNLHLIMAFLGKIPAHCDKPHFLPSRPKSPTPLQTPDPPKKARIGWRVMPARHKHRNINHSMSCG